MLLRGLALLWLLLFGGFISAEAKGPHKVLVVVSQDGPPFARALAGLRRMLENREVPLHVIQLGSSRSADVIGQAVARFRPRAVVAMGSLALTEVLARAPGLPVLGTLVLDPSELKGNPNLTGVYLQYPVSTELEWLRRLAPTVRRLGVVYQSDASHARVEEARELAPNYGLSVHALRIQSPDQIPDALASIAERSDALWGLADPMIFNAQTAKPLLVFSFKHLVALYGPASPWVKAGGLAALERDYEDIGEQSAELVLKVLDGAQPGTLPPVPPRLVRYAVNTRSGELLRRAVPPGYVRQAVEVFR